MKFHHLALLSTLTAAVACASDYRESFSRTGKLNPMGQLSLENVNGDITVRTWDKPEIAIEGEKRGATEEDLKAIDLTIDLSEQNARIRVKLPKRGWLGKTTRGSVTFTITVPSTTAIDSIRTVNSTVTISGVTGTVRVDTVNGRIQADHLGGAAHLATVNGGIRAEFDRVTHQVISARSVNGSIELDLPADLGAKLNASVVNGKIDCEFPTEVKGRFVMKNLHGTVGDGTASVNAETVNGSIQLRKA